MSRQNIPGKVKRAAFLRANGHCEQCNINLRLKPMHFDHEIADDLGGKPTIENTRLLCLPCHKEKTRKDDMPLIAKGRRIRERNAGIRKPRRTIGGRRFDGSPIFPKWVRG